MSNLISLLQQKIVAANVRPKIILAEGWSPSVQAAANELATRYPIVPSMIFRTSSEVPQNLRPSIMKIVIDQMNLERYATALFELRKAKGMTIDVARQEVRKPNVLAALLVKMGEADGEVCGKEYPTKDTLKPALQIIKTDANSKIVSSLFVMERPNEQLIFADCAINVNPTADELAQITKGAIDFAKNVMMINQPNTAMLSYSTLGSGIGESVDKVRQAYEIVKSDPNYANVSVCGEIQFDAAYVDEVRKQKAPNLNWTTRPTVYVFPNIDAGNIGYKIAQRLGGFEATGPILIGLAKPVNDLSRGASVNEIVNVAIITAAQAIALRK